ncbi:MAG: hypothetical protein ACO1RX_03880 [Candidatus Sericytochromatia bacterium]
MPLSAKRLRGQLCQRVALGLALCVGGQLAAWGIEARVRARTPFCTEARDPCQAVFSLNSQDAIDAISLSPDQKWWQIRHRASGRIGWVKAADLVLRRPTGLSSDTPVTLPQEVLGLQWRGEGLGLLSANHLFGLDPVFSEPLQGLEEVEPGHLVALLTAPNGEPEVYVRTEIEGTWFVQQILPRSTPYPQYRTLVRLNHADSPVGVARLADGHILVLAEGSGLWGESRLVAFDAAGLPVMVIREAVEVLDYLPQALRPSLRPESLRLLALDPDGTLLMTANQPGRQQGVLLRIRPRVGVDWAFEGALAWPADLPFRNDAPHLRLQARVQADEALLIWQQGDTTWLGYYVAGGEPVALRPLAQPVLDMVQHSGFFWLLQPRSLVRLRPLFAS